MPAPSVAVSFIYAATEGQTAFNGPDLQGITPALNPNRVQPSDVHVNGVKLALDNFGGGDFTIDIATSTLNINQGLPAGSIVQWDLWLAPSQLAPGSVVAFKLLDIDLDPVTNDPGEFDGVRTTFPLRYVDPASGTIKPCAPGDGVQLQVSIDGVMQEFGVDFSTAGPGLRRHTRQGGGEHGPGRQRSRQAQGGEETAKRHRVVRVRGYVALKGRPAGRWRRTCRALLQWPAR